MNNVKVAESPISGKIIVVSTGGYIMEAVDVAITYLNNPAYNDRDIVFGCDNGGTSVDFPADERKPCTRDDVWELVSKSRGNRVTEMAKYSPPGPV